MYHIAVLTKSETQEIFTQSSFRGSAQSAGCFPE